MNQDIFDRANNIRSKIESYKEIIKALSRPNADIDINWRGFPIMTHEFLAYADKLKELIKPDFIEICRNLEN